MYLFSSSKQERTELFIRFIPRNSNHSDFYCPKKSQKIQAPKHRFFSDVFETSRPRLLDIFGGQKVANMAERKAVIKNADMSEDMQQDAVDCASQALEKYNIEKDIAAYIKKEFDKKYNPTWHAIVGRNFGSYVTHETKHFIYYYLGQVAILLFKSG